jgi:hypothetical protein
MTKSKEKISLYHPNYGYFYGLGDTVKDAATKCLKSIAKGLADKKIPKQEVKQELTYAKKLIQNKLTR